MVFTFLNLEYLSFQVAILFLQSLNLSFQYKFLVLFRVLCTSLLHFEIVSLFSYFMLSSLLMKMSS